jgi:hypothetical protein
VYTPKLLPDLFTEEQIYTIREILASDSHRHVQYDDWSKRQNIENDRFEKEIAPLLLARAREAFNDETLDVSFVQYSRYDSADSELSYHVDMHACVYTIDYCLSASHDWPISINKSYHSIPENSGLTFMGMESVHGRDLLKDVKDVNIEMLFFHFVPKDHWFFSHCEDIVPEESNE